MEEKIYFLNNIHLIDGTGREPVDNAEVLVKGKRITKVGEKGSVDVPSNAKTFDLSGKTLMPGLIDSHVHLSGRRDGDPSFSRFITSWETRRAMRAANDVKALINAGFTSCRDAGSKIALGLRDAINEGTIPGPRILAAGRSINSTYGHIGRRPMPVKFYESDNYADGVEECMKAVRTRLREGSDFIKIATGLWGESVGPVEENDPSAYLESECIPCYTVEEIKAITYEAESMGSFVISHAHGEGVKNALDGGVFSIEHHAIRAGGRDEEREKEIFKLMIEKNAIWGATPAISWKSPEYAPRGFGWSDEQRNRHNENLFWALRLALEMGVRIAGGTDYSGSSGIGGRAMGTNAFNLELLVMAGFSPMDAIVCHTKRGAESMRMEEELGTIEEDKLADMIVVDGNPLQDIKILKNTELIKKVFKDGEIVVDRGM